MKKVNSLEEYLADEGRVSKEELEAVKLESELIETIVDARKRQNMSQRDLSDISKVKQPVIARIERRHSSPQVDTLLKLLVPLGSTIKIVPLKEE
ncbi:MAG: helix-turn-helix transcriptional regulator [Lachnospiraceae bacterium]|nr:helix-turn-helix transcriptional regulator [Lachnospiraceae bacterium]